MKKMMVLAGILFLCLQSCYNDNEEELYPTLKGGGGCDTANAKYGAFVSKIVQQRCALSGCHTGPSGQVYGNFTTYTDIKAYFDNGNKNIFLDAINQRNGASPMPKGSPTKLPACDLEKIEVWINNGYPNN